VSQCTFCNYRDAALLEQQIATKQLALSQAAKIIGCNKSTVSRHMRNCVAKKVQRAVRLEPTMVEGLNVVNALTTSHRKTLEILSDALNEGDRRTALLAIRTENKQLELMAKLTGQLNEAPQLNLLMSPSFVKLKQVLIKTLEPHPQLRLEVSEALNKLAEGENGSHD
jgi:hypothetical protein